LKPEHKYPFWLAVIAAGILGGGWLLKPSQRTVEVISESERARLQEMSQKKNLQDMGRYFAVLADRIASRVVRLTGAAASGIILGQDGLIVSSLDSESIWGRYAVTGDFGTKPATISAAAPDRPVVSLRSPEVPVPSQLTVASPGSLSPGSWVVLLARETGGVRSFIPGVFSSTSAGGCDGASFREVSTNLPLGAATLGAGIFDMDGALVAMVIRCGARYTAMAAEDIQAQLGSEQGVSPGVFLTYGMILRPLDEAGAKYFKSPEGLLVYAVWRDGRASAAGLRPGDVLTSLDGKPVKSLAELTELGFTQAGRAHELTVERAGRPRKITVPAGGEESGQEPSSADLGLTVYSSPPGIQIDSVAPGSPVARAGILPGDRLVEINGRSASNPVAAKRAMAARGARFLVVQRGPKQLGVLIPGQ